MSEDGIEIPDDEDNFIDSADKVDYFDDEMDDHLDDMEGDDGDGELLDDELGNSITESADDDKIYD